MEQADKVEGWQDRFDWKASVERHQAALLRVVAMMFATAGLTADYTPETLPRHVRSSVLRLLRPAESAVRRLIIMAVRAYAPKVAAVSASSSGAKPKFDFSKLKQGPSERVPPFRLYDPRKRFDLDGRRRRRSPRALPHIHVFDGPDPLVPLFKRPEFIKPQQEAEPKAKTEIDPARLINRMKALKNALDDLPKQAKRLVRSEMRRKLIPSGPRCVGPMRPGLPPGDRKKPSHEVDEILNDCDSLAHGALEKPT